MGGNRAPVRGSHRAGHPGPGSELGAPSGLVPKSGALRCQGQGPGQALAALDEPDPAPPLVFGNDFEPNTSLGVRIDGEIVGWMINGLYGADTVLYGSYFVRRPYRNAGMAISLLLEALKRQREVEIPNCVWFAQNSNPEAKRLYDKILAPCILSRNAVYITRKILHDS